MVRTMVGAKKASPWTVMLLRRKRREVEMVTGLVRPRMSLVVSMRSRTAVVVMRSEAMRAVASSFSAGVSQRAVEGRSVRVRKLGGG